MKLSIKISVLIMTTFTAAILILASRQLFGHISGDFDNPYVVWTLTALLSCIALMLIISLFMVKPSLKKIGFYLLHVGIIVFLTGSLLYYLAGVKIAGVYRINSYGSSADAYHSMLKANLFKGDTYTANFESFKLGVTDFILEKYDAVYDVYELDEQNGKYDLILSGVESDKNGYYDFGIYGKKNLDEAMADGLYTAIDLNNNIIAVPINPHKYYEASLSVYNKETGETFYMPLAVNKPKRINGWKIYLMGYDENNPDYVSMIFKYDPGEYITLVGIWFIIVGTVIICFFKPRKKAEDAG